MALIVHSMGAYASYPNDRIEWRRADYDLNKLVKSLKGDPVKGYAQLRDAERVLRRITDSDRQPALAYFSAWAAKRLRSLNLGRVVLVPVPSSDCTSYRHVGPPYEMAAAIQSRMGRSAKVERWLRFAEEMTPSHKGGTRSVETLVQALKVAASHVKRSRVVLVDDVKTTGAHLKASAKRLRELDILVETAIVGATTVWDRHPTPFDIEPEDLGDD
ncbi:hypothetical protein [Methylibium rhizosphaerae]|uniref:hypothetical protein n=1 Tax=Methylibium rhizosphaerae TaxID=2570323 RepID=UPI00112A8F2E|nr:hypothetical protein [Methylibium rhizosphaerae]